MKKLFIISVFALGMSALTACSDEQDLKIPGEEGYKISQINPIVEKAQQAYDVCYGSSSRHSAAFYECDIVPVTSLKSRATAPDTVLYIVNEAEGNGFVALTGGNRPEVLAVSDNGTIKNVEDIDNPGLKMFFDAATEYAAQGIIDGPTLPVDPVNPFPKFKESVIYSIDHCEPRCEVKWSQHYPEGMFCPNKVSGCGATAVAQSLSYFELPSIIGLTYDNADKPSIEINWADLKSNIESTSWYNHNNSQIERTPFQLECDKNLGRFCRELGERMNSTYDSNTNSTSTSFYKMYEVTRAICPSLKVEGIFPGTPVAREELKDGIIVMFGCSFHSKQDSINQNYSRYSGHFWLVDGYEHEIEEHKIYIYDSSSKTYIYSEEESYNLVTLDLQHINWGWRGQCNGYFNVGVFQPNSAVKPDTDTNSSSYNFCDNHSYYIVSPK